MDVLFVSRGKLDWPFGTRTRQKRLIRTVLKRLARSAKGAAHTSKEAEEQDRAALRFARVPQSLTWSRTRRIEEDRKLAATNDGGGRRIIQLK
jgi:hypothetical protein